MRREARIVLAGAALALALPATAQARGGGGQIPCLNPQVIQVASVPHDTALALAGQWGFDLSRIRRGYGVDLGWRFDRCSANGHWVGYIGYRTVEFDLSDAQVEQLAGAAGLSTMPPPPGIWKNPDIIALAFAIPMMLLMMLIRMFSPWASAGGRRTSQGII